MAMGMKKPIKEKRNKILVLKNTPGLLNYYKSYNDAISGLLNFSKK
jgi:hypothetical protein